jgi:uncharacterized membrane protein (UPF0127 family)
MSLDEHAFGSPDSDPHGRSGIVQGRLGLEPVGLRVAFHATKQANLATEAIAGTLVVMIRSLFLSLALALVACDSRQPASAPVAELGIETRFAVRMGQVLGQLRIAATDLEKARGLMGVTKLSDEEGMAFMYESETRMGFWMKDTPLNLDIAFIARDGTVLEVRTMTAGDTETTTSGSDQVRFAIEMRAGWFGHFGVKPGDKVNVDDMRAALKARGFDPKRFIP